MDATSILPIIIVSIVGWGSWVTKKIFSDSNDRKLCFRRVEGSLERIQQELEDFIKYHVEKSNYVEKTINDRLDKLEYNADH